MFIPYTSFIAVHLPCWGCFVVLGDYFSKKKTSVDDIVRMLADMGGRAPVIKKLPARQAEFGGFGALDMRIVNALKNAG